MEEEIIECPDCEDGVVYVDTSYQCSVYPIGDCCGGCGHYQECDTCSGTGEIEEE
jgi:hypothetical protein